MPDKFLVRRDDGSCGLVSLAEYPEVVGAGNIQVTASVDPVTGQTTYTITGDTVVYLPEAAVTIQPNQDPAAVEVQLAGMSHPNCATPGITSATWQLFEDGNGVAIQSGTDMPGTITLADLTANSNPFRIEYVVMDGCGISFPAVATFDVFVPGDLSPNTEVTVASGQPANAINAIITYVANPDCPTPGETAAFWEVKDVVGTVVASGTNSGSITLPDLTGQAGPFTLEATTTDACGTSTVSIASFLVQAPAPADNNNIAIANSTDASGNVPANADGTGSVQAVDKDGNVLGADVEVIDFYDESGNYINSAPTGGDICSQIDSLPLGSPIQLGGGSDFTESSFSVEKSSTQTVAANVMTPVTFDVARHDANGDFDLATNRFIAPVDGFYSFSAFLNCDVPTTVANVPIILLFHLDTAGNTITAALLDNIDNVPVNNDSWSLSGGIHIALQAGEMVELAFFYKPGAANLVIDDGFQTVLSGSIVGRVPN